MSNTHDRSKSDKLLLWRLTQLTEVKNVCYR